MKNKPYKRKPGDFEIRILNNGKVVMMAPDEILVEIAQVVDPHHCVVSTKTEIKEDVRSQTDKAE